MIFLYSDSHYFTAESVSHDWGLEVLNLEPLEFPESFGWENSRMVTVKTG